MSKKYMQALRYAGGGMMGDPAAGGGSGAPAMGGGAPPMDGGMPPAGDPSGGGSPDQQMQGMLQAYSQNRSPELAMQIADMMLAMGGQGQGSMGAPGGGDPMSSNPDAAGDMAAGGEGGGGAPQFMKGGMMPKRKFGADKAPAKGGGKFKPFSKK